MNEINYCFVGITDDQGVANVGGRLGASQGPHAFLKAYSRLKGKYPVYSSIKEFVWPSISTDINQTHQESARLIKEAHLKNGISLIVGGGHDHGYSHVLGVSKTLKNPKSLGCINIDAHLDLRSSKPVMSSGSPFHALIEEDILDPLKFIEFGIQTQANSAELFEYAQSKKIDVALYKDLKKSSVIDVFKSKLDELSNHCEEIILSIDCDAIAEAFAPGVSAPQSEGFTSQELLDMAEVAGTHSKVKSIGIFELNPLHDRGDQTARLAATCAYRFFEGKLNSK